MPRDIFDKQRLPAGLDEFLRDTNPWWAGKPGPVLPDYHREAFSVVLGKMRAALAPAVVVRGPRQVGKTTLQLQIIKHLLETESVDPKRVLRVQFDELPSLRGLKEPILAIARWFENRILGETFNEAAHAGRPAFLFFDEVQNLGDWAPQLKALVDHHTARVLVTGSSALRIEAGRDSLAGRIATVEMGTLLLREIAGLRFRENIPALLEDNGLDRLRDRAFWRELREVGIANREARDLAFTAFSERGGYPMAQAVPDSPWPAVAEQLNETVIQRAIQHDLRLGERGRRRDAQLLEEVFRLACRYAGQSASSAVFTSEIRQALDGNIGWQRILRYLRFLDSAMLIKLIQPLELRLKKRKGASKICLCDHALRASWLQEVVPLAADALERDPHLSDLAGHVAESVVGFFFGGMPHLGVTHFPGRAAEPEVDFVLTVGGQRIPVEIKHRRRIDAHRDTLGLRSFLEKTAYNAPFGLLVTLLDDVVVDDPRIVALSLPSLLLLR